MANTPPKPINLTPLMPPPGAYTFPVMRHTAIDGTSDPKIISLVFEAKRPGPSGEESLLVGVPISTIDAAGILRSLLKLREMGLIPTVREGDASNLQ